MNSLLTIALGLNAWACHSLTKEKKTTNPQSATIDCQGESQLIVPPLRRLTKQEYRNIVRDLTGGRADADDAVKTLPTDNKDTVFSNTGEGLILDTLWFEKALKVAESVAQAMVDKEKAKLEWLDCDIVTYGARTCAKAVIEEFVKRAFRGSYPKTEIARLLDLYDTEIAEQGNFDEGMELALTAALMSPHFLFHVEESQGEGPVPLQQHELAARIAFFVWGTVPDRALSQLAQEGDLSGKSLATEVQRMLKDPRSDHLEKRFLMEWLGIDTLPDRALDPKAFPKVTRKLLESMVDETKTLFREILRQDLSLAHFYDADFTYIREDLASHYGLVASVVGGTPVSLKSTARRGVLGHASILTAESTPVRRGKWILDRILCEAPPPPPPDVGQLEQSAGETVREKLAAHRRDPACASCHDRIDPLGLSLEYFGAFGQYRDSYDDGMPIDVSTELPSGQNIDGLADLSRFMIKDPRVPRCLTQHLLSFALASRLPADRQCHIDTITARALKKGFKVSDLVFEIVTSSSFTMRTQEEN